ncbi:MAG: heme exporter protein CcmD [Kangiellaceae bacterium]|jgi:heme exporter protein CcmD|nr:heme exporter protein CcmD [Kangiellaceae bacterium]
MMAERWNFIWACYGITLIVIAALIFFVVRNRKVILNDVKAYYHRQELLGSSGQEFEDETIRS